MSLDLLLIRQPLEDVYQQVGIVGKRMKETTKNPPFLKSYGMYIVYI